MLRRNAPSKLGRPGVIKRSTPNVHYYDTDGDLDEQNKPKRKSVKQVYSLTFKKF